MESRANLFEMSSSLSSDERYTFCLKVSGVSRLSSVSVPAYSNKFEASTLVVPILVARSTDHQGSGLV